MERVIGRKCIMLSSLSQPSRLFSTRDAISLLNSYITKYYTALFEVCNLCKRDLYSLDFVVNRFFMKLFRTNDISVITYCREMFQFDLPSAILKKRAEKFDSVSFN